MNKFIQLLFLDKTFLVITLAFLFLFLFFVFYLIQYIYISYNLRGICKIIFDDEKYFRLPLEPFNCFFISLLPIVFWRETLNIKKEVQFKKLYGKAFYYPIDQVHLKTMLKQYPTFFYIQYLIYLFLALAMTLMTCGYFSEKYF